MIAKKQYTLQYLCYKCKRKHNVVQDTDEEIMGLKCPRCDKVLFRVFRAHGLDTDTTFMAGSHAEDGFGASDWMRRKARAKAAAEGVNISGARYCPQLNDPGESLSPKAWVRDKADVKRRCAELGVGCEGTVSTPAPESNAGPQKPYRVRDSILDAEMQTLTAGKDLSAKETADLRTKTAKRLAGNL